MQGMVREAWSDMLLWEVGVERDLLYNVKLNLMAIGWFIFALGMLVAVFLPYLIKKVALSH